MSDSGFSNAPDGDVVVLLPLSAEQNYVLKISPEHALALAEKLTEYAGKGARLQQHLSLMAYPAAGSA